MIRIALSFKIRRRIRGAVGTVVSLRPKLVELIIVADAELSPVRAPGRHITMNVDVVAVGVAAKNGAGIWELRCDKLLGKGERAFRCLLLRK